MPEYLSMCIDKVTGFPFHLGPRLRNKVPKTFALYSWGIANDKSVTNPYVDDGLVNSTPNTRRTAAATVSAKKTAPRMGCRSCLLPVLYASAGRERSFFRKDEIIGQNSSTRARVVMVPTRGFDQKIPIEPLEKIID